MYFYRKGKSVNNQSSSNKSFESKLLQTLREFVGIVTHIEFPTKFLQPDWKYLMLREKQAEETAQRISHPSCSDFLDRCQPDL